MQLVVSKDVEEDIDTSYELDKLELLNGLPNWFYTKNEVRKYVVTRSKLLRLQREEEEYSYEHTKYGTKEIK